MIEENRIRKIVRRELYKKRKRDWLDIGLVFVILLFASSIFYLSYSVQVGKFAETKNIIQPTIERQVVTPNSSCLMFRNNANPKDFSVICQ